MTGRFRRLTTGLVLTALLGTGLVVTGATSAQAAPTTVSNVHWTKSKLDVASKTKKSTLKIRAADRDGVCSVWARLEAKGRTGLSGYLGFDSGKSTNGTWSATLSWDLSVRGTWRLTQIEVRDCDGRLYFEKRKKGIGRNLVVYSSKKVAKVKVSSVPSSLLRDARDTANVKLTAGGKRVKGKTVRLKACNESFSRCWTLGKAMTNSKGVAKVRYTMPRKNIVVYGYFAATKKITYGYSGDHFVSVLWKSIRVGMALTISPRTAIDDAGNATAVVTLSQPMCGGSVHLYGGSSEYLTELMSCTRRITFDIEERNDSQSPVRLTFHAVFDDPYADGDGDDYYGESGVALLTVPGRPDDVYVDVEPDPMLN